jgi:diacylglycerol kinase family enzyme
MYKDIFIVANPIAGTQNAPRIALDVLNYLRKNGANAELVLSQKPKDAIRIANQIENPQSAIVACGGDGTVQEIISVLKMLLPQLFNSSGRCNDFARAIGFHNLRSPSQLAEILLSERLKYLIVASNGKKFLPYATLGLILGK